MITFCLLFFAFACPAFTLSGMENQSIIILQDSKKLPFLPKPLIEQIAYEIINTTKEPVENQYIEIIKNALHNFKQTEKSTYTILNELIHSDKFKNHLLMQASNNIAYQHTATFNSIKEYKRILAIAYLGIPLFFESLKNDLGNASLYSQLLLFDGKFCIFDGCEDYESFTDVMSKFPCATQKYCAQILKNRSYTIQQLNESNMNDHHEIKNFCDQFFPPETTE